MLFVADSQHSVGVAGDVTTAVLICAMQIFMLSSYCARSAGKRGAKGTYFIPAGCCSRSLATLEVRWRDAPGGIDKGRRACIGSAEQPHRGLTCDRLDAFTGHTVRAQSSDSSPQTSSICRRTLTAWHCDIRHTGIPQGTDKRWRAAVGGGHPTGTQLLSNSSCLGIMSTAATSPPKWPSHSGRAARVPVFR